MNNVRLSHRTDYKLIINNSELLNINVPYYLSMYIVQYIHYHLFMYSYVLYYKFMYSYIPNFLSWYSSVPYYLSIL